MTFLLGIHLLALGIWIGVVGAEFAIEIAGMKDAQALKRASILHYQTDLFVEIPAFLTVLVTGLVMLDVSQLSGLFAVKLVFAVLAILLNTLNVYAVILRRNFALRDDIAGMESTAKLIRISGLIIPCFLIAFGLGIWSLAGG